MNTRNLALIACFLVATIFSLHYIVAKALLSQGFLPLLLGAFRGVFGGLALIKFFL